MPLDKAPNAEPIRGYRLIEPLGSGGFGEVWKCEAPGGIYKAIKFVHGTSKGVDERCVGAEEELRAVQHIKSIRHPFLLSIDRVEIVEHELVIVTELADQNLNELLQKYQTLGKPGVPREEILSYLREAAEVLDLMNHKFDLQHLDIKPHNLFLVSNHVKVADFGLVNRLSSNGATTVQPPLGAVTPLYAAPELFQGKLSRHCDQYSLAIVYQELLTGSLPFAGRNSRQLLVQHTQAEPELAPLPAGDRPIIARALAKNPEHRFASCMALIQALAGETAPRPKSDPDLPPPAARPAEPVAATPEPETGRSLRLPALPPAILEQYHFQEQLLGNPLMESWKVQAGRAKARHLKVLYGFRSDPKKLQETVAKLKALHHPGLVPNEVLHVDKGQVALLSELVKETVRDRFQKCLGLKLPGIPRAELVDYLRAAAEVLDYLYQQHGLQHLGLNPRSFVLDHGWLQLHDFGLNQLLWLPAGQELASRNARYCAPELFDRQLSRSCDQFGLALVYCEMLTGQHPFAHLGNLAQSRRRDKPNLDSLAPTERDVIRRALDPDPARRWPTCTEMVLALEGAPAGPDEDRFDALIQENRQAPTSPVTVATVPNELPDIDDLIHSILGDNSPTSESQPAELDSQTGAMAHRFQVNLPVGAARVKLDGFCRQWYGQVVRDDEDALVMHLTMPSNFWQQWMGREPGLEVRIAFARVNPAAATPIEIGIHLSALRCSRARGQELIEEMGPQLIDSARKHLLVNSEKRTQDRIGWPYTLRVIPVHADGTRDEAVECRGKDISQSGIGFYLPHELTTSEVLVELPSSSRPPRVQLPAMLVRAKPCADGWYEVGALFRVATHRKSHAEIELPALAATK